MTLHGTTKGSVVDVDETADELENTEGIVEFEVKDCLRFNDMSDGSLVVVQLAAMQSWAALIATVWQGLYDPLFLTWHSMKILSMTCSSYASMSYMTTINVLFVCFLVLGERKFVQFTSN